MALNLKNKFPLLQDSRVSYLDSAATTQTPSVVLAAMDKYYTKTRANIHRGIYDLSEQATKAYEAARATVANFIHAKPEEIIFTTGTTLGLNQLAYSLCPRLSHRENVVLTRLEHHANLVPWQQMSKHYGFEIRFIELKNNNLDLDSAKKLIDENTKIVGFTLVSNVLGCTTPARELVQIVRKNSPKAYTIVDAAQAMAHVPVDVQKLDCDFLVFSGHKMYGPTGIGVLYGKKIMLEEHLEPFFFGGEMVKAVSYTEATWNDLPYRFEAGTPNIAGAIGLSAAVAFIQKIGWKKITTHEAALTKTLMAELKKVGAQVVGLTTNRIGVVSFTIPGVHPHDVAEILNREQVAVRAGLHCAEPLHKLLGLGGTVRASLGIYSTASDIKRLITGIKKVQKLFARA